MDEMRRRMMMRDRQGLNISELSVENGKILREVPKEELEFALEKIKDDLSNSKNEITNHENAIKDLNEKIKELEEKEEKTIKLIKELK